YVLDCQLFTSPSAASKKHTFVACTSNTKQLERWDYIENKISALTVAFNDSRTQRFRELPPILVELIAPFEKDDKGFVDLLCRSMPNGATVLHLACKQFATYEVLTPLLERIKKLPPKLQARLLNATDDLGNTFLHHAADHVAHSTSWRQLLGTFDAALIQSSLVKPNANNHTVFHCVCISFSALLTYSMPEKDEKNTNFIAILSMQDVNNKN